MEDPGGTEGAPGALLAVSWRSLGAVWSPGTSFSSLFFFPEALCFRVLRHRSRNRHRLLVFSFGNFRSTWALALVSRAWACALESWALARGSWALAWALTLGSWALTLGFRLWGLRLFSSGASALRSWALVSGFSSGAFGCIFSFSSEVLGFGSGVSGYLFSSGAFSFSMQPESLWGFSSSAVLGFSREVLAFRSWGFGFSSAPPQPKPQPPLGL